MSVAIVTGSAGLIGSETARFLAGRGIEVVGLDNDMRSRFFGAEASTAWSRRRLEAELRNYRHFTTDIRDADAVDAVFARYGRSIIAVVHTAAQPSHDWAARDPRTDFSINANGTLEILDATRRHCPDAAFVFTSTNKVYGDRPNDLPLVELDRRWEVEPGHPFAVHGIDETMSIDACLHSVFGASKVAADVMVQEYGRYFGMKTACFRGGCLTGPNHSGTQLHGFLAYLARCAVTGTPYVVHGYKGKQVRDNIHAYDLVSAFWAFINRPRVAEVYNMGGGRDSSCSVIEAIELCEGIAGRPINWRYDPQNRVGDHIWWISDVRKFQSHYPEWNYRYDLRTTLEEIVEGIQSRVEVEEGSNAD
jgi:CDP-paratose 2-epimerase